MWQWLGVLLLSVFAPLWASTPSNAVNWSKRCQEDISQARKILYQNAPEVLDHQGVFMTQLDKGYQKAQKRCVTITTKAGYYYLMSAYFHGFNDPHIAIFPRDKTWLQKVPVYDAGIKMAYHHGAYEVVGHDKNTDAPAKGSTLLDCDGVPIKQFVAQNLMPYYGEISPSYAAEDLAHFIFFDKNPLRVYPKSCRFRYQKENQTIALYFKKRIDKDRSFPNSLLNPKKRPFGIRTFGDNGVWIALPGMKVNPFTSWLGTHAHTLRSFKPMVIDLRGNEGGNDIFWADLMENLFGISMAQVKAGITKSEQMRLTPFNLTAPLHMKKTYLEAYQKNQEWYPTTSKKHKTKYLTAKQIAYDGPLYLLTDRYCMSSCLTFIDFAHHLPHTYLIGQDTKADTLYGEVHKINLGSYFIMIYPMKAMRYRARGSLVPYKVQYHFDGNIEDTKALMAWVLSLPPSKALSETKP